MNPKPSILVIGDVMADRYFIGTAHSLSAEAPVPVIKITDSYLSPGGAGNVVANLLALGADVRHVSGRGTPVKNRLVVGGQQLARWDQDDVVEPILLESLDLALLRWAPQAVVVSDYNKGSITPDVVRWIDLQHLPTYIDTKRNPEYFDAIYETTFFPNLKEWREFLPQYKQYQHVVLKKGPEGLIEMDRGVMDTKFRAYASDVKSVCGAGDVVIANYAYAKTAGRPDAAFRASIAAAIAVEQDGTVTVSNEEIDLRVKEL